MSEFLISGFAVYFEKLRKPISFLLASVLFIFSTITVPENYDAHFYEFVELFGFFLLIIAALGRIWCSLYISGRKNTTLCKDGPYSLCRNPLYFFSFIGVIGFFLSIQNMLLGIFAALIFLVYYRGVITSEERRLRHLFHNEYEEYLKHVPRFWPSIMIAKGHFD